MKSDIRRVFLFLFFILVALFAGYVVGYSYKKTDPDTAKGYIVIRDTIKPPIPIPEIIYKTVPTKVDTAAILADYFAEKHYHDTIIQHPCLKVELSDVISQNQLIDRTVSFDYQKPVVYNNALSLGLIAGKYNCGFFIGYRRKKWAFTGGYDIYNKAFIAGISKDIWQW